MEWLQSIPALAQCVGAAQFLADCTATDIAFIFLASKPVFVAAALWVGFWSYRSQLPDHHSASPMLTADEG